MSICHDQHRSDKPTAPYTIAIKSPKASSPIDISTVLAIMSIITDINYIIKIGLIHKGILG